MWTLRRGSLHLRNGGLGLGAARISLGGTEITKCYMENCTTGFTETRERTFDGLLSSARFSNKFYSSSLLCSEVRMSSQAGSISSSEEKDDLDDDFTEIDNPHVVNEDDLTSELEEGVDDAASLGTKAEVGEERSSKSEIFPMATAILNNPAVPVRQVMEKWVEEGNEVTQTQVSSTMHTLFKWRMFLRGLQLSECLESSKHIEFLEANYASHVRFLARVNGPNAAEEYIENIPESFRGELVFRELLSSYVTISDLNKSVQVFNRMKKLGFALTTSTCNRMLFLYLKRDQRRIADVLTLMEKENLEPDNFTYWVLINVKGKSNDITGMEQIVETMVAEGVEPTHEIQSSLASYYVKAGLRDKADVILKEIEGDDLENNPWVCRHVLPLYASMGREDEVERIWNICEPNAVVIQDCQAAIEAWGKLKRIEKAEAVSDKMMKLVKKPSSRHFVPLLTVYADNKMIEKGKDLVKRMGEMDCHISPMVWDVLVKLYVGVGDVEKADAMLEKATKLRRGVISSYLTILEAYSGKGDVHNAEKIFSEMRKVGYVPRFRIYQTLLQAYVKAKTPAYGFVDRMKGDNLVPNGPMAKQLAELAARKSEVLDLL